MTYKKCWAVKVYIGGIHDLDHQRILYLTEKQYNELNKLDHSDSKRNRVKLETI